MTAHAHSRGDAPIEVDVIVVGAGLAGLTTATKLLEGRMATDSVAVLEARDRVGGRTLNHTISSGHVVEAGGEYVGPTQGRIAKLAEQFGVETFPAYTTGMDVYIAEGKRYEYDPKANLLPPQLAPFLPVMGELQALSEEVKPAEPWVATNAPLWDSQTVQSWIGENAARLKVDPAGAVEFVELFFNSAFGGRAMDVSLLFTLGQIAGFGDEEHIGTLERGVAGEKGAQESRFVGGSQLISLELAKHIEPLITLNAPVRKIEQSADTVTVISDAGTWTAGHAVVAVPPPLAVEIEWEPLLPAAHDMLRRRMALGTLAKCMAIYDEPFWRKKGLSGFGLHLDATVVKEMFDNTPSSGTPGVLNGFVGGHAWRGWQGLPVQQRKEAVLNEFAAALGAEAEEPVDYFEADWTQERWTRGCPVSALETGVTTDFLPIIAQPFGLVHWAGTETASYWNGFMDGAVRSGERAAEEIIPKLRA